MSTNKGTGENNGKKEINELWNSLVSLFRALWFYVFNWIFIPSWQQAKEFVSLKSENRSELLNWMIFTVFLAFVPFVLSLGLNYLYDDTEDLIVTMNNGVIPIISFNIITSGVFFLLDYVRNSKVNKTEILRKKILGISIALIFINVTLYTILTGGRDLCPEQSRIVLVVSLIVFIFSVSSGVKMFLLQKKFLESPTDDMNDTADDYVEILDGK